MHPPDIKHTPDAAALARRKLAEQGPVSRGEKVMLGVFVLLLLLWAGVPAMLLYRRDLDRRSRVALAVFTATELPLVVAITTIAVDKGEMGSGTAASLVGAAVLSTAVLPMIALRIRASMQKTYVA